MKSIVFRIEARLDALEAYRWYEARDAGRGEKFRDELDRVLNLIAERPLSYPAMLRNARRALLKRFPYLVVFRNYDDAIVVVAVMHSRRGRRTLKRRL
jgi:plasmid stabilization system protein ParE